MTPNLKTSITFVNHASVIVSDEEVALLSDPWYEGHAFNKGWSLLHETSNAEAERLLNEVTHIWISHEHPDHFSVPFFKNFAKKIRSRKISILFQRTTDKRVANFLRSLDLQLQELDFNEKVMLSTSFYVTCIKDGFYDSGLLIESNNEKILNLNDCEINSQQRADEVLSTTGKVDVLLTQFSFAAWKGGRNNIRWRREAAEEKINTVKLQVSKFSPKYLIPFASYIFFSNSENSYLNDSINTPNKLIEQLSEFDVRVIVMAPDDTLGGQRQSLDEKKATKFWESKYKEIGERELYVYEPVDTAQLEQNFLRYCSRISGNNNMLFIKVLRKISPIKVFKPIRVKLTDRDITVEFDYVYKTFKETADCSHLAMKSESLNFLFNNSFGFDTLTVNGCFEEDSVGGFVYSTKSLAIENLNNLGIQVRFSTLFNISIIKLFLTRLYRVARKLE